MNGCFRERPDGHAKKKVLSAFDRYSVHSSAPGEDRFFVYLIMAEKRFDSLDSLLDIVLEQPRTQMEAFKEISRKPFNQDGFQGMTVQAEENDGKWTKIFYTVILTDTHQYFLRAGCRLDRFQEHQPNLKKILDSLYVGPPQKWKRKNTYPVTDREGRYASYLPPGWKAERQKDGMKAADASGRVKVTVAVSKRKHRSLDEFNAVMSRTLQKQFPSYSVGRPTMFPAVEFMNAAARSFIVVTGPEGSKTARLYAFALSSRGQFVLEAVLSDINEEEVRAGGIGPGGMVAALWQVHLRGE